MNEVVLQVRADEDRLIRFSVRSSVAFAALSLVTYVVDGRLDVVYAIACTIAFVVGVWLFALGMWNGIQ